MQPIVYAGTRSGRTTSLHELEPEKIEGAGSWDAIEWTKVDQVSASKPVSQGLQQLLLEAEFIIVEGHGVVLVNTDEAGNSYVTNFRLLFLSDGSRSVIGLGTIPLAAIEKFSKTASGVGEPRTYTRSKKRKESSTSSSSCLRVSKKKEPIIPRKGKGKRKRLALVDEESEEEEFEDSVSGDQEDEAMEDEDEMDADNSDDDELEDYILNSDTCYWLEGYEAAIGSQADISKDMRIIVFGFRPRTKQPLNCSGTGAVLARSSQPLVGLMMNMRSNADEKLVAALWTQLSGVRERRRKLYIADARPRKNALANGAMAVGQNPPPTTPSLRTIMSNSWLKTSAALARPGLAWPDVLLLGPVLLKSRPERAWVAGRKGRDRPRPDAAGSCEIRGATRHGGWTWGGGNLSSMSASVSTLGDSSWLIHIQGVLAGSAWIVAHIALESATVLVHCSDGWDRTTQLVSLASLLLDPYYRTFKGFQVFLVDLVDSALSCRFGNFFCNSERERQQAGIYDACGCLWVYLADLRASDRSSGHYNHFYDASKFQGPLLPPAAALAPTLWPQFHLRWACPSEAQAGEIEAHWEARGWVWELGLAKDLAEAKLRETTSAVASLTDELRNEKLSNSSIRDWARSAKRENVAIKRAIQSLGCKVQFSEDGDCIVGIENIATEIPQKSLFSIVDVQSSLYMQSDEKPDSLVYVTRDEDDDSINPIDRVCESLCPLCTREGGCRWPEAGCDQFGSQFVGLKANFDAFDRLSIYDSYIQSQ
ncbi:hypothetical protein SASPL_120882 [Salvia splendens]|uniref:Myotubularin phosphatase domain-containing protein n=1 Tax=Salvia splendens TaxID=180675 RepID=A0A8X8ZVP6_SALSN|nr:hypothetical protein SASPL_120882 [Salvia splendens]